MTLIAMTREMGTLGKEVAREFALRMNYSVLHTELVGSPGERDRREGDSEVYSFLEGTSQELEHWRTNRDKRGYLTASEIFEIAAEGDVLIRGWGIARLLKSVPNILSVRVCAPMDARTANIMDRLGVDERTARREIRRSDAAHSSIFSRFFETDWQDPLNYDLALNTANVSPNTCADILCDAVANPVFHESEAGRQVLQDKLIENRICTALTEDDELKRHGRHVRVTVEDAHARLYGLVTSSGMKQLAESVAIEAGARSVSNEIVRARS
jgi:cytidylate kinase